MKNFIIVLVTISFISIQSVSYATSWAYQFVVWEENIYVVSEGEYVTEVEQEIGEVTNYSDMEQFGGNFSNAYPKGTKYYSIKGIKPEDSIAIEVKDGNFIKATREGPYTYRTPPRKSGVICLGIMFIR
ncbi:MAG TPA: hypothetical protein VEY70_07200 [Metabacillus sp.]|nr:hypothetical protein [Metabacillus sp.]